MTQLFFVFTFLLSTLSFASHIDLKKSYSQTEKKQLCEDLQLPHFRFNQPGENFSSDQKIMIDKIASGEFGTTTSTLSQGENGQWKGIFDRNYGEDFISLGLGHYLWYYDDKPAKYNESFPKLIDYLIRDAKVDVDSLPQMIQNSLIKKENGSYDLSSPPEILRKVTGHHSKYGAKWFIQEKQGPQTKEVVRFLMRKDILAHQLNFQLSELKKSIVNICMYEPSADERTPQASFNKRYNFLKNLLSQGKVGLAALTEYMLFKGDGTNKKERYKLSSKSPNRGWGVFQVVDKAASGLTAGSTAIAKFRSASEEILVYRAQNDPKANPKWASGWRNRSRSLGKPY